MWPDPAHHIDIQNTSRCGIYRFDGDKRLTLAFGVFAAGRPKTFDQANGVELVALRPLAEAEAEWEAQARKANELPPQPASDPPATAFAPTAKAPAAGPRDPPHVADNTDRPRPFVPVPPIRASGGPKEIHVNEYTRKDGTVVHAHNRAAPGMGGGRKK
jgi:hypothetical protein